jgi:small-conductance mechanosensitive channel
MKKLNYDSYSFWFLVGLATGISSVFIGIILNTEIWGVCSSFTACCNTYFVIGLLWFVIAYLYKYNSRIWAWYSGIIKQLKEEKDK